MSDFIKVETCVSRMRRWMELLGANKKVIGNFRDAEQKKTMTFFSLYGLATGVAVSNCLVFWRLKRDSLSCLRRGEEEDDETSYPIFHAHLK